MRPIQDPLRSTYMGPEGWAIDPVYDGECGWRWRFWDGSYFEFGTEDSEDKARRALHEVIEDYAGFYAWTGSTTEKAD